MAGAERRLDTDVRTGGEVAPLAFGRLVAQRDRAGLVLAPAARIFDVEGADPGAAPVEHRESGPGKLAGSGRIVRVGARRSSSSRRSGVTA